MERYHREVEAAERRASAREQPRVTPEQEAQARSQIADFKRERDGG